MPAEFSGDPYALLGVTRDASPPDIKEAYRRLAKATHPDVDARPEAMAQMVRLNQAYELLADPSRRQRWDALNPLPKPSKPGATKSTTRPGTPAHKAGPVRGTTSAQPSTAASSTRPGAQPTRPGAQPTRPSSRPAPANPYPDPPNLEEALAFRVGFGAYHGRTLREVAMDDPGYLDWIIRSVKDRPRLVACTKLVRKHLPEIERSTSPGRPTAAGAGAGAKGRTIPVPPMSPEAPTTIDRLRDLLARERVLMLVVAGIAALVTFLLAVVLILVMSAG